MEVGLVGLVLTETFRAFRGNFNDTRGQYEVYFILVRPPLLSSLFTMAT